VILDWLIRSILASNDVCAGSGLIRMKGLRIRVANYIMVKGMAMERKGKAHSRRTYIDFKSSAHLTQRPVIKGTRITVDDILEASSEGLSAGEIAEQFKIPKKAVLESLKLAYGIVKRVAVIASG
jgi:uncharacterized protein (DUF433 family)